MRRIVDKLTPANFLQFFQIARYSGLLLSGIILAKAGITVRVIGLYEFVLFLSGLVSFFWIGGIFQTVLSEYHQSNDKKDLLQTTFNTILSLGLISSLLVAIVFFIFYEHDEYDYSTIAIIGIFLFLNTITFFNEHYYLLKEKYIKLSLYAAGNFSIQLAAILIAVISGGSFKQLLNALFFVAIWKFFILIYNLVNEKITVRLYPDLAFLKLCSPLIAGLLISGSAEYIDSFLVLHFYGNESYAIFKYGAKEFPLSLILANSLSAAMVVQLSKSEVTTESLSVLKSQSSRLMNFVFPVTWIFLLSSKWIYPLVFNPNFLTSSSIFNIYLLLIISRSIFPQSVVLAMQRRDLILKTAYWEIAINVISSVFFMMKFGVLGIAYGTVIAFLSEKIILCYHLKKLKVDFQSYTSIGKWFWFAMTTIIIYFFVENFL